MKPLQSLRVRLVMLTVVAVALVWLITSFVTWREAHRELEELLYDHPVAERQEIAGEIAEHLLKPMLWALPALALLLVVSIGFALRPLKQLAQQVAEREPDHLAALPNTNVPAEVLPLVGRLNELFVVIARTLENERRFTADAAHELRTPLAAIKAQAQVALVTDAEQVRSHALQQIVAGCDRATHLVEQLLMLARLDAPQVAKFQAVDLHRLAAEVLAASVGSAHSAGSTIELDENQADPVMVSGDSLLLSVALRNLLENALRHNPPGTVVSVVTGRTSTGYYIGVIDTGPGIPATERELVLQRFNRGSRSSGTGSGLGLSIVQRIAQLHGAKLTLGPRVDAGGTAARLDFPAR